MNTAIFPVRDVPDDLLVECLQMFKSTIAQDYVRCKKTKPNDALVFVVQRWWGRDQVVRSVAAWGLLEHTEGNGIIQIFVGEDWRRQGVGRMLYDEMEKVCWDKSWKPVHYVSDRQSRAFYKAVVHGELN